MKKNLALIFLVTLTVYFGSFTVVSANETVIAPLIVGAEEPTSASANQGNGEALNADMQAQLDALAGPTGAGYGPARDPRSIVARYVKYLIGLMGIVATGLAVYAGYLILMSQGEEEKVNEGKRVLKQVVIGVILLLSSYSIVLLVERFLTGNVDRAWQKGEIGGYEFNWKIEEDTSLPRDPYIY